MTHDIREDIETVRKVLAWVGYNAPNESDRLRAYDADISAQHAVSRIGSRLAELEEERDEARDSLAGRAVRAYENELKERLVAYQELEKAARYAVCLCTEPCVHISIVPKQRLEAALSNLSNPIEEP